MRLFAKSSSPWAWIPTLYFAQGLPYVAVMTLSVIMYKRLGISNTDIALYTGWLNLPWVLKPVWSPFVDIISTKRRWTLAMEWCIAIALAGVAFTLPAPMFFRASLAVLWLMAFASATHDIAADGFYMLALSEHEQSFYVGIRSTFYRIANVAGQGVLVILAGYVENAQWIAGDTHDRIVAAWCIVFGVLAVLFVLFALWHGVALPHPAADAEAGTSRRSVADILREFADTFGSFFHKPGAAMAIVFLLLYRLPEAQLVKLINPFLLDPASAGGLGLSTGQVGFAYGTVGIISLTVGGIVGGLAAARSGLRRWLWPMAWSMSLTCLAFVYLSYAVEPSYLVVNICVAVEQFGYGFGFTAYMLYMIYFSEGPRRTSHYAICTGFMALGMMLPGMAAGWIQETLGYRGFFLWTMLCCVATIAVCAFIKVDPQFGLKKK